MKKIISIIIIYAFFSEGFAFGESYLSPGMQLHAKEINVIFQSLQKENFVASNISFMESLVAYINRNGNNLPIRLINNSVLVSSLIRICEGEEIPLSDSSLKVISKLLKRKKVILVADVPSNGTAVFNVFPYDREVTIEKLAGTLKSGQVWSDELNSFLNTSRKESFKNSADVTQAVLNKIFEMSPAEFKSMLFCFSFPDYQNGKGFRFLAGKYGLPERKITEKILHDNYPDFEGLINAFCDKKILQAKRKKRGFAAKIELWALFEEPDFKRSLTETIIAYYASGGAEVGINFMAENETVAMLPVNFVEMKKTQRSINSILGLHTHFLGLGHIHPQFFIPSGPDFKTAVISGEKSTAVLWGDPEIGFYITLIDAESPSIMEVGLEIWKMEMLKKPLTNIPALIIDDANRKFYKLIPEGNRRKQGLAFSYYLQEVSFPQEALNEMLLQREKCVQRILRYWQEEQKRILKEICFLAEKEGKDVTAILGKRLEAAVEEKNRLEAKQRPKGFREGDENYVAGQIRLAVCEHEIKMQNMLLGLLSEVIKKHAQNTMFKQQTAFIESSI